MDWKTALYDFMHNRNETEADYDPSHAAAGVTDERFLEAERLRQERRRELGRSRGLSPLRCETRLKLLGARSAEGTVWVDVDWNRLTHYRIGQRLHREERMVRERIGLSQRGGRWIVRQVDTVQPDEAAAQSLVSVSCMLQAGGGDAPSDPSRRTDCSRPSSFFSRDLVMSPASANDIRRIPFYRERARHYAELWWSSANPKYLKFDVDCANFVSQCLFAGEAPMNYTGRRESGWWYRGKSGEKELWSFSWAVANSLQLYLRGSRSGLRAEAVDAPEKLSIGDVITYSFDGSGRFGHSAIVTAFDGNGMPLVNAHTVNSRRRYWDYRDSYAWTERTIYRFFHIPDEL